MIFWLFYLGRLIWDAYIARVPGAADAIIYFVITVLLPCTALALAPSILQERFTALLLVFLGGIVCGSAILIDVLKLIPDSSLFEVTARLGFEKINPISLGHVGASVLIAALCLTRHRIDYLRIALVFMASFVAGWSLILASSRGPALALAICVMLFPLVSGSWRWSILMVFLMLPVALNREGNLWLRFADIQEDISAQNRLLLQGNSISQFLAHPVIGSAYLELEQLDYPHNIFIETVMALGVVGGIVFAIVLISAGRKAILLVNQGELLIPLLFVQYFVGVQFSGAIYGQSPFWATVALLVGLATRNAPSKEHRELIRVVT
jgi:O-antigen ligase